MLKPNRYIKMRELKKAYVVAAVFLVILILGMLPSGSLTIPVAGATNSDWNKDTFWYEPWGKSGVHKGIDIFAAKSIEVISPAPGFVLYSGKISRGGNIVVVLAGKWRIHYFAHLDQINTVVGAYLSTNESIGTVGDTGNAKGKQPHLHYSIFSVLPHFWKIDSATQGWKKMFFLNPIEYFN